VLGSGTEKGGRPPLPPQRGGAGPPPPPPRHCSRSSARAARRLHADHARSGISRRCGQDRHADRSDAGRGRGRAFRVVLCDARRHRGTGEIRDEQLGPAPLSPLAASPTLALAEFAATLEFGDLPADVVDNVKLMVLDSLGCAIAATTLGDGCRETIAVMGDLGGRPESTIIGTGRRVSAPNAAFTNGALVHALNYDPIGGEIGHLGVVCLAAPLAMAEAIGGLSGAELLTASAVACEISARITAAIARTGRRPS